MSFDSIIFAQERHAYWHEMATIYLSKEDRKMAQEAQAKWYTRMRGQRIMLGMENDNG